MEDDGNLPLLMCSRHLPFKEKVSGDVEVTMAFTKIITIVVVVIIANVVDQEFVINLLICYLGKGSC